MCVWGGIPGAEGGAKQKRKPKKQRKTPDLRGKGGEGTRGAAAARRAVL